MARLTRHQMKQDDLGAQLAAAMEFSLSHKRTIGLVALVSLGVVAIGLGSWLYVRSRQQQGAAAFEKALNTYHAPVLPAPPQMADLESYTTDTAKNTKALEAFQAVARDYSFYAVGRMARYYAAICLRDLERYPEAEKEFQALSQLGDRRLASLAKLGLASVYALTNRPKDAEAIYKDLESNPTETVPKLTALVARADLYRQTNAAEASALYRQIQADYPNTPAADYAGAMLNLVPQ
ncbi:MAG TPA: hypothetical protein VNN17_05305 [Terriglobia bacterium]|nr:hypothetical protein [Terriglobia bacterium]